MEQVVDLLAFSANLPREHRELKQRVKDALDVFSALNDLKLAGEFAARSADLEADSSGLPIDAAQECTMALLCSAIVFYGRATKGSSRHRKTFDLRPQFDEIELERHDLICRLRDDAVAHYGPGELPDGVELREDKAFLSVTDGQLLFTSRSISGSLALSHLVSKQAQRALILSQKLHEERQARLLDALHERIPANEELSAVWKSATVDLKQGIGDDTVADELIRHPQAGIYRFVGERLPSQKP